jgi:poly-gamma-glutamate synthesis protein (capsule biosynthesis protein)
VTFMAVGDNLIHKSLYTQAKARARHGLAYDFAPAYAKVKSLLARADLSFINQETVVAGAVGLPSSYPMFNSPTELGDTVYDLGFRAVCLSNNHMLDKGTKGALASLDYWAGQSGVVTFGAYRGMADFQTPRVLEVNGIKFAFVAATFSYNGLRLPQDSPLVMPLLEQEDVLRQGIATARAAADVVVVSLHWGVENSQTVIDAQRALAQKCVNWGAEVILGSHPHVLQTMEFLTKPDGGHAFVIYSLGNFISAQNRAPNLVGGVLELTFEKPSGGAVAIRQPRLLPLVTQYEAGYSNVRLIPWAQYTPALANAHGVRRYDSRFSYHYIETLLRKTIPVEFLVME